MWKESFMAQLRHYPEIFLVWMSKNTHTINQDMSRYSVSQPRLEPAFSGIQFWDIITSVNMLMFRGYGILVNLISQTASQLCF
jgi:uncharacterized protein with PQ loop repeat